ncbi:MAG TPA: hypothetical protein VFC90_01470 [Planctomycetota bacterium]|nr:hypothetical protein [Planctomycetota bacterium]
MTPRRDLHRAVDGELSKQETRRLEKDPLAKAELDRLKAISQAPREVVQPVRAPSGFKKKILDEIRRQHRPKA